MSALNLGPTNGGGRYPGFDTTTQLPNWDSATRTMIQKRLGPLPEFRFFTETEQAIALALFDQLLYQRDDPRVPVLQLVDARLASNQTDGWHYETMESDADAWRSTLRLLDDDANVAHGRGFADCEDEEQHAILETIRVLGNEHWHGMVASHVWSLWTRYACTAFYSHPLAWNEIGFDGPAYPRGYKNLGVDRLEGIEVRDAQPTNDPVRVHSGRDHPGRKLPIRSTR